MTIRAWEFTRLNHDGSAAGLVTIVAEHVAYVIQGRGGRALVVMANGYEVELNEHYTELRAWLTGSSLAELPVDEPAPAAPASEFIRLSEVMDILCLGRTTIYTRLASDPNFPRPTFRPGRGNLWVRAEVERFAGTPEAVTAGTWSARKT